MSTPPSPRIPEHRVKVLLVDDQILIGETIRRKAGKAAKAKSK